jgi:hypothetical protein
MAPAAVWLTRPVDRRSRAIVTEEHRLQVLDHGPDGIVVDGE